jgi:hypothetical protein
VQGFGASFRHQQLQVAHVGKCAVAPEAEWSI